MRPRGHRTADSGAVRELPSLENEQEQPKRILNLIGIYVALPLHSFHGLLCRLVPFKGLGSHRLAWPSGHIAGELRSREVLTCEIQGLHFLFQSFPERHLCYSTKSY